jgi:hypothetical protein
VPSEANTTVFLRHNGNSNSEELSEDGTDDTDGISMSQVSVGTGTVAGAFAASRATISVATDAIIAPVSSITGASMGGDGSAGADDWRDSRVGTMAGAWEGMLAVVVGFGSCAGAGAT